MYLDDVMVIAKRFSQHLTNPKRVFERFCEANLKRKPEKCYLAGNEVLYLRYVVSRQDVSADPTKIEAVQIFPQPSNVRSLRSFFGLALYYRRFIQKFSTVASTLYALAWKVVEFLWKPVHQDAVCHLN